MPSGKQKVWTSDKINEQAQALIAKYGIIPPECWLRKNNFRGFVCAVHAYAGGLKALKAKLYTSDVSRLICRAGMHHDSFGEVCVSNFLWSRGIVTRRGRRYPQEYVTKYGKRGVYDLEFEGKTKLHFNKTILVEIWGNYNSTGKSPSKRDLEYAATRKLKEEFNKDNAGFLGIEFEDCYTEQRLNALLKPFIGNLPIVNLHTDHDKHFLPAVWTIADDVMKKCQYVMDNIEDDVLPPIQWFTRTGSHSHRKVEDWEINWSDLPTKIHKVGGISKVRKALGQTRLHLQKDKWNRSNVIQAIKEFIEKHNEWPSVIKSRLAAKPNKNDDEKSLFSDATSIHQAAHKHIGDYNRIFDVVSPLVPDFKKKPLINGLPKGIGLQKNGKYLVRFTTDGQRQELGTFEKLEDAIARLEKAKDDKKHGRTIKEQQERILPIGISKCPKDMYFRVRLTVMGKSKFCGDYSTLEEATAVLQAGKQARDGNSDIKEAIRKALDVLETRN